MLLGSRGSIDPADKNCAWLCFVKLVAKLEEFDEVGDGPFRVGAGVGEIGEMFLDACDGGIDCGQQLPGRRVFRRREGNGLCIHAQNLAGGMVAD
jgi:hypothetical protein